jgi:hypothetical protein
MRSGRLALHLPAWKFHGLSAAVEFPAAALMVLDDASASQECSASQVSTPQKGVRGLIFENHVPVCVQLGYIPMVTCSTRVRDSSRGSSPPWSDTVAGDSQR